jgi:hypothetical protein
MAAYALLFEAAFDFLSARFSFRDLDAAVLALFFFGDLSAIGHPSLGSTNGFGTERLPLVHLNRARIRGRFPPFGEQSRLAA